MGEGTHASENEDFALGENRTAVAPWLLHGLKDLPSSSVRVKLLHPWQGSSSLTGTTEGENGPVFKPHRCHADAWCVHVAHDGAPRSGVRIPAFSHSGTEAVNLVSAHHGAVVCRREESGVRREEGGLRREEPGGRRQEAGGRRKEGGQKLVGRDCWNYWCSS